MTEHDNPGQEARLPGLEDGNDRERAAEALQQPQPMTEQEVQNLRTESRALREQYDAIERDSPRPADSRLYAGSFQSHRGVEQCGDCAQAGVHHTEPDGSMSLVLVPEGVHPRIEHGYEGDPPPDGPVLRLGDVDWMVFDSPQDIAKTVYIGGEELSEMGFHDAQTHPYNVPDLGRKWAQVAEYARAEQAKKHPPEA